MVAVLSLAGFLGGWWWALDLAANFRPHYVVALLVAGVALAIARRRRLAMGVLLVAVFNAAFVVPLYMDPPRSGPLTGESLRILSFNVEAGNKSYGAVVDYIRQTDPDVVFLHEATRLWVEALDRAALGYTITEGRSSDLIFSTLVLAPASARVESYGFTETEPRAIEVTLTLGGDREVVILGVHSLSPDTERRALLRDAQLSYAAGWAQRQDARVVVVGDFNASPWSRAFRSLVDEANLINSQRGFGIQASFPADRSPLLRVPIDHLLHSGGLLTVDRRLGPRLGSDHFPLLVDLAVTR